MSNGAWRTVGAFIGLLGWAIGVALVASGTRTAFSALVFIPLGLAVAAGSQIAAFTIYRRHPRATEHRL